MVISSEIFDELLKFNKNDIVIFDELKGLDISNKSSLNRLFKEVNNSNDTSIIKVQAIIDYMYEQVNIGSWKEVQPYIRKTITAATYLKLLAHFKNCNDISESFVKESFKTIDSGLLFGCPLDCNPTLLHNCATYLNSLNLVISKNITTESQTDNIITNIPLVNYENVKILNKPSMEEFLLNCVIGNAPVVLDNCIEHWPALNKWKDQNYILNIAGLRTVSVELGSKYTDSDWTQSLMTIEDFINTYINKNNSIKGYLAQYQLFNQIPELKEDIVEPEYCCFTDTEDPVDINAWYGPKGTVSPLHYDPKKNLLAQVVGDKQIFLFSPSDTELLYPHEHELLHNTARVDPRHPDYENYPKFKEAHPFYCVLKPGQMLYIPPKWWHFVESLSISFSVSFWWK